MKKCPYEENKRCTKDCKYCLLYTSGLSKEEVHGLFERTFDFSRPKMYELGYANNNCVGCVKGGMGYWNHIRKDFPEVFESRAKLEREVGHSMLKDKNGPVYLDKLEPNRGDMNTAVSYTHLYP